MALAEDTLQRLLERGERAKVRGSDRVVREAFKAADSPYWKLSYDARGALHERVRRAAATGAVSLHWSRQGGEDRTLDAVELLDLELLASHLGFRTAASMIAMAKQALSAWLERDRVREIVAAWEALKQVRGLGPGDAGEFADALRVVDALAGVAGEDRIVRQMSIELFGNSKRIEELVRPLDLLTAEHLGAPARHWQEIFGALGLAKEPQPFLVAGAGQLVLSDGERCPIVQPFVGVANQVVRGYQGSPSWLLTIENLTTFHLAARHLGARLDGLVIYTGGMPSPAWRKAYRALLDSLPVEAAVYHWGDFDEGGFRIARVISEVVVQGGRQLLPWLMDPSTALRHGVASTSGVAASMARLAGSCGWDSVAAAIAGTPELLTSEQESLALCLPECGPSRKGPL